jgi:sulfur carrier protein
MNLTVNGEPQRFEPAPTSVDGLLDVMGVARERVAVEVNGEIVRRAERPERSLSDGDVVEIVTLVGGG